VETRSAFSPDPMSSSCPSSSRGSAGNVLAALANVFLPGIGQLAQGRPLAALCFFLATTVLMLCCFLGLVPYVWAIVDAARWQPPAA
jgi:hypothetical protein